MPETEPAVAKNELADQKPFVIRGHHLSQFVCFATDTVTPQLKAKMMRTQIELEMMTSAWGLEYGRDVMGTKTKSARKYEKTLREIFGRFVSLPDDHPVELTEEMPDDICKACVVGQHCREIPRGEDGKDINVFLKKINLLNLPKPVIVKERTHPPNSKPKKIRRIETTIGTIKKVLKEGRSEFW